MKYNKLIFTGILLLALSCGKDDPTPPDAGGTDFGQITSAMILVNPVINEGTSATLPASGTVRENVSISSGNIDAVTTGAEGIAIIKGLPVGTAVPLTFDTGEVTINVVQEKEFYDVIVSYDENGVQETIQEVRYALGGEVVKITTEMDNAAITTALKGGDKIVFFGPGIYEGLDISLTDNGVILFGSYDEETKEYTSIIKGNIAVQSKFVRIRGLIVEGDISLTGSDFASSYCVFVNATMPGNNVTLIHNEITGTASVTGNNVILLDNTGL